MRPSISPVLVYLLLFAVVSDWRVEGKEYCSPSSCGKLKISNPFYLKGDPDECGEYELICDGSRAVLELNSIKYYVLEISYDAQTIRVADFVLANGACALPSQSLSPDFRFDNEGRGLELLDYSSSASFVKCRSKSDNPSYSPVPCLSRNDTYHVYVTDGTSLSDIDPFCGFLAMIPTVPDDHKAGSEEEEEGIFEKLQQGFIIHWYYADTVGPWKFHIHKCFQRASRLNRLSEYDYDSNQQYADAQNTLQRLMRPFLLEINFLNCLNYYQDTYRHSQAVFKVAVVLIVLLDIVATLIVIALVVRFVLAPLAILAFLANEFWNTQVTIDVVEKFLRNHQALAPKRYGYTDIIAMTRHFKHKLGQGGFGSVYKGELPGNVLVAVKMLGNSKCNGDDFISEVSTVGRIHHVNVVRLVGFCSEGSNRALVYEYLPKGSLDKYIFSSNAADRRPFTWEKLNDIALGVARGIDYLHRGCDMRILHFDIKPHNILMDNSFNPKVSDFGLAKLYPKGGHSMVSLSAARGTIGYIAPEQISRSFGVVSYKSDVYSFGMLLLEMVGGRRNVDPKAANSSQIYYPSWVYDQLKQQEAIETIDATAIGEVERKLSIVGLWCIQTKPSDRPSMSRVVEMLEADVQGLQMPPKPFFSSTPSLSTRETRIEPSSSTGLSIISEHDSLS